MMKILLTVLSFLLISPNLMAKPEDGVNDPANTRFQNRLIPSTTSGFSFSGLKGLIDQTKGILANRETTEGKDGEFGTPHEPIREAGLKKKTKPGKGSSSSQ